MHWTHFTMNRRIPENKLLGRMTQNNSNGNANGHHLSLFYSWYRTTAYSAVRGEESCFSRLPGVTWEDFSPVQRTWSSGGHGRMCFQHGWIVYTWCLFVNVSECFYLCGKSNNWYNLINICKVGTCSSHDSKRASSIEAPCITARKRLQKLWSIPQKMTRWTSMAFCQAR